MPSVFLGRRNVNQPERIYHVCSHKISQWLPRQKSHNGGLFASSQIASREIVVVKIAVSARSRVSIILDECAMVERCNGCMTWVQILKMSLFKTYGERRKEQTDEQFEAHSCTSNFVGSCLFFTDWHRSYCSNSAEHR